MDSLPMLASAAAAMGFAGGMHCSAMCGPIAMAAGCRRRDSLGYLLARTAGYVVLGAVAGALGAALGARFPRWGQVVAGVVGLVVMLIVALRASSASALGRALARVTARAPSFRGPLLGLVGLALPCGLLHGALALAWISGSPSHGAVVMLVFAAVTGPFVMVATWVRALLERQFGARHALLFQRASIWAGVAVVTGRTAWFWLGGDCH